MRPALTLAPLALLLLANDEDAAKKAEVELPPIAETMLKAALASGNEGEVNTVAKYLRNAVPEATDNINQRVNEWKRDRAEAKRRELQEADFFALLHGRAEMGVWITTGNTRNIGLNGVVDLRREGLNWRHKLRLSGEYQESLGVTNRERYFASYEPNYKIGERAYVYGSALFESDRFLGYTERYSASVGSGYSFVKRSDLQLDMELGPAYRYTDFRDGSVERNLAARGSLDFMWRPYRTITLEQDASAYIQDANSTVTSKTAVRARLLGPVSGQLSYTLVYESEPPGGRRTTDTVSRASVVYEF